MENNNDPSRNIDEDTLNKIGNIDENTLDQISNIDGDTLDQIGKMMGHNRDTMNKVKQMMKNPEAVKQMKRLMNQSLVKTKPEIKKEKTGRNDLCICGSGKKYKKCCLAP